MTRFTSNMKLRILAGLALGGCWLLVDRLIWPASGRQEEEKPQRGKTGKARTLDQKKTAAKCEAELMMVFDDVCRFLQCF